MKKAAWHKTRGSIESPKTLAPLAGILCKQYRNENQLLSWCGGWEKESPAGCACLLLLPQPTRPSLIDERETTQIGSPPVSTQFPFLYSHLRLEYSSRKLFRLHLCDRFACRKRLGTKTRGSIESTKTLAPLAANRQAKKRHLPMVTPRDNSHDLSQSGTRGS